MAKEKWDSIKTNLISTLIWELILSLPSAFTLTKYIIKHLFDVLKRYNINTTVVCVALFIIIETVLIFLIKLVNKAIINKNAKEVIPKPPEHNNGDELKLPEENDDFLENEDYYFENYTKHVTIYENGNGIIMNTFDIYINNTENFKEFKRKINVEDGKKDLKFPPLSKMKETSKAKRFHEFGFWLYKPKDSIIGSTIEKYWSDNDPDEIDHIAQNNPKELRWVFEINRSKAKNKKMHRVAYAISIPGLYPLEKGKFNHTLANEAEQNGKASTSIQVDHYTKKITYIVSFANGINLKKEPECFTVNGKKIPVTDLCIEEGVFYNKYIFTINEPSYGTNITIKWEYQGGVEMDKESGD